MKRFVNAAHELELAVLLDVVYNHFGPVGNYAGKYGPYLIDSHKTPWGGAINLEDSGSREVRRFLCDNAIMWLRDFHIDGLRLDAVHAFVDRSAIHFLEQLSKEVNELASSTRRTLLLIAESDLNDPQVVTPRAIGGWGMDAQWSDDFHHALFSILNPNDGEGYYKDFGKLEHLAKALKDTFVYDGTYSEYRDRIHGRPVGELPQSRFIGFIQNHDQVGNRAIGDRLHEIVGLRRAKIAAAIVLTSPFIPLLFQGEEWAASSPFQYFADHEKEMARLVSAGRKKEFARFGWDPDSIPDPEDKATFEHSKLDWSELSEGHHAEMLEWYRDLIQLRFRTPSLHSPTVHKKLIVTFDEEKRWLSFTLGAVTVICNLGTTRYVVAAPGRRLLLASNADVNLTHDELSISPDSIAILG